MANKDTPVKQLLKNLVAIYKELPKSKMRNDLKDIINGIISDKLSIKKMLGIISKRIDNASKIQHNSSKAHSRKVIAFWIEIRNLIIEAYTEGKKDGKKRRK